ncbi:hypothetical protein Ae201684P_002160 [Aphanomyces euteiches]|nr:hypothetical protein Ae201684P_002160 [Aphanomyces euteiches]KAH9142530.1 hypothetical protein AeRB84_013406 [Aphanomyces euteiches]
MNATERASDNNDHHIDVQVSKEAAGSDVDPTCALKHSNAHWQFATPMHVAAYNGRSESIQWLLEEGCDVNSCDENGVTPLHAAAASSVGEAVMPLLIANRANVNAVNCTGQTPLHYCAANNRLHGAATLLSNEANIHAMTASMDTALHLANFHQDEEMIDLLLGFGADPVQRNTLGHLAWQSTTTKGL